MKKPKLIFLVFLFAAFFLVLYSPLSKATTLECEDTSAPICIPDSDDTGLPDPGGGDDGVLVVLENLANWLLGIFGVVAIIGLVISGFQYITAAGSEKTIETAKRNATYSIIGIVIALSAFIIIQAVDAALNATSPLF